MTKAYLRYQKKPACGKWADRSHAKTVPVQSRRRGPAISSLDTVADLIYDKDIIRGTCGQQCQAHESSISHNRLLPPVDVDRQFVTQNGMGARPNRAERRASPSDHLYNAVIC